MERVVIFVDAANLHHALVDYCGKGNSDLDFADFANQIVGDRKLIRTYYYDAAIKQGKSSQSVKLAADQQRFFSRLHNTPYLEIRLGRLVYKKGAYMQKGVDTKIAIDMLNMAVKDLYDVAVLISADSDLVEAVQSVKDLGKHVELGLFSTSKCYHLRQVCDSYLKLDSIADSCLINRKLQTSPTT